VHGKAVCHITLYYSISYSLKWDEGNLAETEAAKSSTMKITEPKTPFAYSNIDDEEIDDDDDDEDEEENSK